jgi:hypothetical protein
MITSPPYNVSKEYDNDLSLSEYLMFLTKVLKKTYRVLTHADGAVIELAEDDYMVYRAASGTAEKQLGLRLHKETSLSGLCVQVGHALQCSDSEEDPRVDKEACRKVGLRSITYSLPSIFENIFDIV